MLRGTHACMLGCVPPTLNTAVRVEFMARQVPSLLELPNVNEEILY